MEKQKELTTIAQDELAKFAESLPEISYTKIKAFDKKIQDKLRADISEEDIELRPDGIPYLPEIKYRKVLMDAFGSGGWALKIHRIYVQGLVVCTHCFLFVNGRFVSEAVGEADYIETNKSMTYATCIESAKSNALMRCCKDLGIGYKLWDPVYIRDYKKRNAIRVWCTNRSSGADNGKTKQFWRKKDGDPIEMWPWTENESLNSATKPEEKREERKHTVRELYDKKIAIVNKAVIENDFESVSFIITEWKKREAAFKTNEDKALFKKALDEFEEAMKKINTQLDLINQ